MVNSVSSQVKVDTMQTFLWIHFTPLNESLIIELTDFATQWCYQALKLLSPVRNLKV